MGRVHYRHLWSQKTRTGGEIWYYRRGGQRLRITAPDGRSLTPGDAGFPAAYGALHAAAERTQQGKPRGAPAGSLSALAHAFQGSEEWQQLRPLTQQDYRRALDAICGQFGDRSANVPRKHVFTIRDAFARDATGKPTPSRANKIVRVLSVLLAWGHDRGEVKENTALRPGRLKTGDGYSTWTEEHFWQFMDHPGIGEPIKRAAAFAWFTGLRVHKIIEVPRSARKGGWITTGTGKTKDVVSIPEHPDLTQILDTAPLTDATTLLTRPDGRPWKVDHIKHAMRDAARAAGLPAGLSFHGLRKGLTASLVEQGATDAEVEGVIPHTGGMTRHYRKQADQKRLAGAAIARLPERRANQNSTGSDIRPRKE